MLLANKVALVTGATRGIGKGIALQLSEAGALVYITGRTLKGNSSLEETSKEIEKRGGKCFPIQCDHESDRDIADLFKIIESEQNGQLDILVNNAFKAGEAVLKSEGTNFWEFGPEMWDEVNNVGLRNHYICSVYAARMMVKRRQGLIVNISSAGGLKYIFNAAYGIGKAAMDRMAADCGFELRNKNVAMVSLYPGVVKTELAQRLHDNAPVKPQNLMQKLMENMFVNGESTEFNGKVIAHLAQDKQLMKKYSGKIIIGSEYAQKHGIKDIDNRVIYSFRQAKFLPLHAFPQNWKFLAYFIPSFIKIPNFIIDIFTSKLA